MKTATPVRRGVSTTKEGITTTPVKIITTEVPIIQEENTITKERIITTLKETIIITKEKIMAITQAKTMTTINAIPIILSTKSKENTIAPVNLNTSAHVEIFCTSTLKHPQDITSYLLVLTSSARSIVRWRKNSVV